MRDGDVYVVRRLEELVIVHGRNLVPSEVEECIESLDAIENGRSVVLGALDPDSGEERMVVVVEGRFADDVAKGLPEAIERAVRERFGISPAQVVLGGKDTTARTTGGKRQRSLMRALWPREKQADQVGSSR